MNIMIFRESNRANFGSQPRCMINNNVSKTPYGRTPLEVYKMSLGLENKIEQKQDGSGLFDKIKQMVSSGLSPKEAVEKLGGIYTGEIGTAIRNMIPSSDSNARPGFPGELHAVLKLPNGRYGVGNWIGPGTRIEERLRRGDPGRTVVDTISKKHDIDYSLAKSQKDVAKADRRMIASLKKAKKNKTDNNYNIQLGMRPIQAKLHAEKLGLVKPGKIATFGDAKDKTLVRNAQRKLEQEGYGLGLPGSGLNIPGGAMLPGDRLKMKMLKKTAKSKKKPTRKGSGLKLAGQGHVTDGLAKFAVEKLIPLLLKRLKKAGIPILKGMMGSGVTSYTKLRKALSDVTGIENATLSKAVKKYAKAGALHILPKLLKMLQIKMSGGGVKDKLNSSLVTALMRGFKWFLNKRRPAGTPELFSGSGMSGKGFFKDFGKGFTSVFKTAYKYGKPLAPLVPLLL